MKHIHFDPEPDGFYGAYWPCQGADCAVIAMLGDDPEDHMARSAVKWLLGQGVSVLTMSPAKKDYSHHNYPLERIETAIAWLKAYGNERVAIAGASTTGTLVVVVMFPNPDETLKPGQFARVEASVGPVRPRVVVPQQAVSQTQDIASVWVVEADSTVHYRRVTPGDTYGAMWCIDEGLDRGERVVVAGQQKLHDGAKVIPENPTARRTEQAAAAEQAGKRLEKR